MCSDGSALTQMRAGWCWDPWWAVPEVYRLTFENNDINITQIGDDEIY